MRPFHAEPDVKGKEKPRAVKRTMRNLRLNVYSRLDLHEDFVCVCSHTTSLRRRIRVREHSWSFLHNVLARVTKKPRRVEPRNSIVRS